MNPFRFFIVSCLFLIGSTVVTAQEHETKTTETVHEGNAKAEHAEQAGEHEEHEFKKFSIGGAFSHAHISSVVNSEGDKEWLNLPSYGLYFNYWLNQKWGIGLHSDIIIEEFDVEDPNADEQHAAKSTSEEASANIERGTPIAAAIVLMYQPLEHLVLVAGGGMEFSKHEDFALIRFGVDIPFEMGHHWEVFGTATYDINIDAYDSYNLGLGVAKRF